MMNRITIIGTIIIIAIMIGIPTYNNVKKKHDEREIIVIKEKIISAATKCFIDEKCHNNQTTLKELYDHKYLDEKLVNPKNKEYYSEDIVIDYTDKKIVLNSI